MTIPSVTPYSGDLPLRSDPPTFPANAEDYVTWQEGTMTPEINATVTAMNTAVATMSAIAAGGAMTLPYTFSSTTTDADPGAGYLRLDNATQNTATTIRADLLGSDGSTWTDLLNTFDDSTSVIKGHIMLQKLSDGTKWLVFSVSALASPSGYKNITVANVASSAASPFANGDALVLKFTRTGDAGATGATGAAGATFGATTELLTSGTSWVCPAGVTKVRVRGVGGGGSGGKSANTTAAGAGSGGGYFEVVVTTVPTTSYTYAIGAAGASQTSNAAGNNGGNTTWNDGVTTYTGSGGVGGKILGTSGPSAGGTGTNGTVNISGGSGQVVDVSSAAPLGGGTPLGLGGVGTLYSANGGIAPTGYGSGSGGASSSFNSIIACQGCIILEY